MIFNTELATSVVEDVKHPRALRAKFEAINEELKDVRDELNQAIRPRPRAPRKKLERREKVEKEPSEIHDKTLNIAVYWAITVRTDGDRVVLAQKLERPRGKSKKWDIYQLEREENGPMQALDVAIHGRWTGHQTLY